MKNTRLLLAVFLSLFIWAGLNAQPYIQIRVSDRGPGKYYEKEIRKGIRTGQLTRGELRDLNEEWADIERLQHRALRNGRISFREQRKIDHAMLDFERLLNRYLHNRHFERRRDLDNSHSCSGHNCPKCSSEYEYYYKDRDRYRGR